MERADYVKMKNNLKNEYDLLLKKINPDICDVCVKEKDVFTHIQYVKLMGCEEQNKIDDYKGFFNVLYSLRIPFVQVYTIESGRYNFYLGCDGEYIDFLTSLINRQISTEVEKNIYEEMDIFTVNYSCSGILVGDVCCEQNNDVNVIDQISKIPMNTNATVVATCVPMAESDTRGYCDKYCDMENMLGQITSRQISYRDERESISFTETDSQLLRFKELMKEMSDKFRKGIKEGMFSCTLKIFADSMYSLNLTAGGFLSALRNENVSTPLSLYKINNGLEFNSKAVISLEEVRLNNSLFRIPIYSNLYTISQLESILELPSNDLVGYYHHDIPDFDLNRDCSDGLYIGDVVRRNRKVDRYYVSREDLNRHIFVPGMTGSGKTNTIKCLLYELWKSDIPWLVVEPAKAEYYEMYKMGIENLNIISIEGNEVGLKINPFQPVNSKIPLQEHIDSLYAALMASFNWTSPMPYVLEVAIYRLYELYGFDLLNEENNIGLKYPNIEALFWLIPFVVEEMNYEGRLKFDVISSIQARLSTLRRGVKGEILNVENSMDFETVFSENTVIELENIKDNDTKSFVMSLLCILLREYRMQQEDSQENIKHFFLLEEAHRILKKCAAIGDEGSPRANGVEFFSEMLAELRSKGQGFILADQIPEQLVESVNRNTNLKIVHRLVSKVDANLMGDAMRCSEEQISYIPLLKKGQAIIFSEGDYGAKLVQVPNAKKYVVDNYYGMNRKDIIKKCQCDKGELSSNLANAHSIDVFYKRNNNVIDDELLKECNDSYKKMVGSKETLLDWFIEVMILLKRESVENCVGEVLRFVFEENSIDDKSQYDYIWIVNDWLRKNNS